MEENALWKGDQGIETGREAYLKFSQAEGNNKAVLVGVIAYKTLLMIYKSFPLFYP